MGRGGYDEGMVTLLYVRARTQTFVTLLYASLLYVTMLYVIFLYVAASLLPAALRLLEVEGRADFPPTFFLPA